MTKIIELRNIKKKYQQKFVLDSVSFDIEEGSFTTLIGCNGAGKSTTLRLISGNEAIDGGSLLTFGLDPYAFSFPYRSDVFFIHENYQISFPVNLLEMMTHYRKVFPRWSDQIFNEILKERKFSIKKNFMDLSRGQRMQFLLMVALASRPKLLLLDEITSVIDIDGQRYFLEKLKKFTRDGGSLVITTNILSEMDDFTDHLILLQDSRLMVNSKAEEMKKRYFLLKDIENYPLISQENLVKVRHHFDGKNLYLASREILEEDTGLFKYCISDRPRLEDILIFHFKNKKDEFDEKLVA
jgi:ABC-2 type transport system ATP-binding protein